MKPGAVKNLFDQEILTMVRDKAIEYFVKYPPRCRLGGMTRELTEDEKRAMAFFEASLLVLNSAGLIDDQSRIDLIAPIPTVPIQEVITA